MQTKLPSTLAATLALLPLAQIANAYDWEADFIFADADSSSDPVFGASLSYYLAPITHGSTTPWSEIPFTERVSDLSASVLYSDQEYPYGYESETQMYGLGYNHRDPDSPHTFSLALGYQTDEISFPRITYGYPNGTPRQEIERFDLKSYNYGVGYSYYLQDAWTIGAALTLDESSQADQYSVKASTKRIWDLGNQRWFGLQASVAHNTLKRVNFQEDNLTFGLQGSYYLSPRTELSAEVNFPDDGKPRNVRLSAQHFLTDSTFVAIAYSHTELAFERTSIGPNSQIESDGDSSNVQAKLGLRF